MISEVTNEDCMVMMQRYEDKFFDLAIVDPPYNIDINHAGGRGSGTWKDHERKLWDKFPIDEKYFFIDLFRVSKNQIIWGGNYFTTWLPASMGWIFWDKRKYTFSTSDGELAYSSFDCKLRVFSRYVNMDKGFMNVHGDIHPTQKPVALYSWLLKNYAKPGDKILDTHLGSGSSRIAAYKLGFDFWGTELDKDYFDAAEERFKKAIHEPLFQTQPEVKTQKLF